jgi:hypothetical protein
MQRRLCVCGLTVLLAVFAAAPVRAGLVVSIDSTTVAAGGTGSVEVDITNNGNSSVAINTYAIQLVIAPTNGTLTQLAFSVPTSQQLGYLSDTNYIFVNDSFAALPPPFVGLPTQTIYNNDTFTATDSTVSGNTVSIAVGQTFLLAILPITTLTQLDPQPGDSFSVSLNPTSGTGSNSGGASTYFDVLDSSNNETSYVSFTSSSGTVTISPAAVPEPSSIVSGLTAILIGAGTFAARRIRQCKTRCQYTWATRSRQA